ncbi:hypothetical protein LK07_28840 [Streptomyces pluripotens]|uniref:Uncharacterized protein n=1 Tax=Streptomyces pluripotens TaxID=1355015 RepID=A0A221P554_9ACTN|nr:MULTISPECIES: DUF6278 family protein [Streptomyces]ARP73128.1 hypothetical protein LK06_027670 [Streptomyces pluripotens]ASN27379.1 hypothetical protein LK07_28840 [Streptomyces pluripotens]KIE28650.1 hypothetical protein LK08_00980 [Streptomyces sp. MUSC 125]MCH0558104.1 hypothetical protein [Streptomyces sp. MUM 16J]
MNIPFPGHRRKNRGDAQFPAGPAPDSAAVAGLLSECELLRSQAARSGVCLDDTPASLEALDQLVPRWREDAEALPGLGNDAGLYLGTVVVRTVPGAAWEIRPDGEPVVRLASGREVEVVPAGRGWAVSGVPELSQQYAEIAET